MAVFLKMPASEYFHFAPGQYLDVMLPQNRRRSFSIASTPGDGKLLELHIRRVSSGEFTQQLFDGTLEKSLLRIEGPLGQFWFRRESPRPALLVGGGTGYAPLRSMLHSLLEVGDRRQLYSIGARRRLTTCMRTRTFERCAEQTSQPSLSSRALWRRAPKSQWRGRTGWVHKAALEDHPDLSKVDVYASGSPVMVEDHPPRVHASRPAARTTVLRFVRLRASDALAKLGGSCVHAAAGSLARSRSASAAFNSG